MKKLTGKSFKQQVLENGFITIDKDGRLKFVVARINDENFKDINPTFKEQLIKEGKYNSWIGFLASSKDDIYSIEKLPIYGDPNKYVTKWITRSAEESVDQCLSQRSRKMLKRANAYLGF